MQDFSTQIITRTKEILQSNFHSFENSDREFSFLINCLLGLMVAVHEKELKQPKGHKKIKGNIDDAFLSSMPTASIKFLLVNKNEKILSTIENKVILNIAHKSELINRQKTWLLTKIRNGIAHLNIEAVNDGPYWASIVISNFTTNGIQDFEMTISKAELKEFAISIASYYSEQ